MSKVDITNETLKNHILTDRMKLLNTIQKDCAGLSNENAVQFVKNFNKRFDTYLSIDVPVVNDKKRKKKVQRFRKISPYLAFCANYRDSKRGPDGKLKDNVLEITKQAGSVWKSMSEKDRKPWEAKANELTEKARIAWDKKTSTSAETATVQSGQTIPSQNAIREMKKSDILVLAKTAGVNVSAKASLKEIRESVISFYYSQNPTTEQINKMKKSELQQLIAKVGLTAQKDTKSMQSALISHYYPTSAQ